MLLDVDIIHSIVEQFNIGEDLEIIRPLESGFSSDNYHIRTSLGDYVVRVLHESVERIEFGMLVHEYLADNGIKTPRPMRTRDGSLTHSLNDKLFAIQVFIRGADIYEPLEAIDPLLPFYGKELGRIHKVLLRMTYEMEESIKRSSKTPFSWVHNASKTYMPEDQYVQRQYELWEKEIETISESSLTMGITHGDVGPKDFFFDNGDFTGIMDFNSASYGYLLSDVVSMMMYSELIRPERTKQYITFINSYLSTAPLRVEELKWLHLLFTGRCFVQIFYHQYRYVDGITQGLDTDETEENLVGVREGIEYLRITNQYSKDYFYQKIVEKEK
ncbi:MAG: phosphotransferase [Candidatus Thorarchaeota archaeon]|jgi:Ser/Thr protein kinase RdoA (MazF antagonist)